MIIRNRKSLLLPVLVNKNGVTVIRCSGEYLLDLCPALWPHEAGILRNATLRQNRAHRFLENREEVRRILGIEDVPA
jgi:hypothetical protein